MEIGETEYTMVDSLKQQRRLIADALTEDPNEENPYALHIESGLSEMSKLAMAKEYVKLTEEIMEMEGT